MKFTEEQTDFVHNKVSHRWLEQYYARKLFPDRFLKVLATRWIVSFLGYKKCPKCFRLWETADFWDAYDEHDTCVYCRHDVYRRNKKKK